MGLDRIRGQEQAISLLKSAFGSGRLAHAYLLRGPYGVGKETVALELAKALHCEAEGLTSCGKCPACKMSDGLSHPDTHLIFPVPRTIKSAELAERISESVKKGFRDEDFGRKTAIISVETILTEVVVKAGKRPYIGPWKVFIISDADRMTTEAANTLLKTLEEPPVGCVLILVTSNADALLPTIRSRCQRILFVPLAPSEIATILQKEGHTAEQAAHVAAIAGGSLREAERLASEESQEQSRHIRDRLAALTTLPLTEVLDFAAELAAGKGEQRRDRMAIQGTIFLDWARSRMTEAAAAGDLEGTRVSLQILKRIHGTTRDLNHYANAQLSWESLLLDLRQMRR